MFVCIFFFLKPPARLLPAASYKDNQFPNNDGSSCFGWKLMRW